MQRNETPAYRDTSLSFEERAADLVSRMTLEEKVSQMIHEAPAIERLGVPEYVWWNECLHGVARAGVATVFPQSIGLAATWDLDLMRRVARVISDEGRAKHHDAVRSGNRGMYYGLTFWSPNVNIFRDPRWGRGQETYGEDPFLTARMGVEFVKGIQGDDPKYMKAAACAKHYAVHSGPEEDRHKFDAIVSEKDLRETYLPAFEALVREAGVEAVMGAYNRTNGEPCCAHSKLIGQILRGEWGFEGHFVSDCGAISDIYKFHGVAETPEQAAALAVKTGCDLNCGETYPALVKAVKQGLISEEEIDVAVRRLMLCRMRLGMFDPDDMVPYAQIPIEKNDCPEHRELALEAARESIVLLKNTDGFLPLDRGIGTIAVIGPNADDVEVMLGNYNGTPSRAVTPLEGIRKAAPDVKVLYAQGCEIPGDDTSGFDEAVDAAKKADVVIAVMGLSQKIEGEEGEHPGAGDRMDLGLPEVQQKLLEAVHATGTPLVVVLQNGSPLAINWADEHAAAIIELWYPGEEGGTALAEVLFGDYNPAGRLPVTFYRSVDDLPPFADYSMDNRTYRYFAGEPLYPFGYGLSYTTFGYTNMSLSAGRIKPGEAIEVAVDVENTGGRAGDEVVQVYLRDVEASVRVPRRQLVGFRRVHLQPGEKQRVAFTVEPRQMALVEESGARVIEPGVFELSIGGGQPAAGADVMIDRFEVIGQRLVVS